MNLRPFAGPGFPVCVHQQIYTPATWARGDVQFIGRGVPHEAKNTGGNTFLRA